MHSGERSSPVKKNDRKQGLDKCGHFSHILPKITYFFFTHPLDFIPLDFSISVSILIPWQGAAQVARNRKLPGQNKP